MCPQIALAALAASLIPSPAPAATAPGPVFVMALGSARLAVMERLAAQDRMPAFKRLLAEGAVAPELLNLYPNKSHTPWLDAATGATAGAHRVLSIMTSESGAPPFRQDLLGVVRQSEFLWEAAERQGKLPIVLNFPDAWPSRLTRGIQIGGASLSVNATFYTGAAEAYRGPIHRFALAADELFSTEAAEGHTPMKLVPLEQSGARPPGVSAGLAARLELGCKDPDREIARKPALWLVAPAGGSAPLIYLDGAWAKPPATAQAGSWTQRIDLRVESTSGPVDAALRIKLLSLDANAGSARLYVTPLSAIRDGRVAPPGAAPELAKLKTIPIPTPTFLEPYSAQRLDPNSQRELLAMNGDWCLEALRELLKRPFDLFVFHTNDVDWAEHAVLRHYRNGLSRQECRRLVEGVYEDLDKLLAGILAALPPRTTLLMMSQHGVIDPWDQRPSPSTMDLLEKAGLLHRRGAAVDYEKSAAYPGPEGGFVYVRPRNPQTPEQEAEREKNLRAAIRALATAVDGPSGQRVFSVVLPWEDAAPFGLHGKRHADILALRPAEFGGIHGACYPLTAGGESTLKGFYLFWGARARAGIRENRPVGPADIAPTAAHLLGIEPPADSSGGVLRGMLR